MTIRSRLPELVELERLVETAGRRARVETLGKVEVGELVFPLYGLVFGSADRQAPTVGLFGGVHGLERIGTQVLLSYLQTVTELISWDSMFQETLKKSRLVFLPLVNPGGMYLKRRSNPGGVDLMRNAPVHADKTSPLLLYAGQRLSSRLPWYRGPAGAPLEPEAAVLCDFVRREVWGASVAVTVDVHSGFGALDRVWFPYARTHRPFHSVSEVFALKLLLDRTYPNHIYRVEPQSHQYRAHGDLWDYLYDEHRRSEEAGIFLPLSLELGSWNWVKKNLRQAFSVLGPFNPQAPHRLQRTLRRHLVLFEFLQRAVLAPESWARLDKSRRETLKRRALEYWYAK